MVPFQRAFQFTRTLKSSIEPTIEEQLVQLRRDEQRQFRAGRKAIRVIHAAGPDTLPAVPLFLLHPSRAWIGRGAGARGKASPRDRFIGWYVFGQRSGKPNRRMAIERELDEQLDRYLAAIKASFPLAMLNSVRGQRSGIARRAAGLVPQMAKGYAGLARQRVPVHHRAQRIAAELSCNVAYVRRVIRALKKGGRLRGKSEKNGT